MELSININDEEIYPISSSCINVMDFHDVQFFLKVGQDEDIEVYVEDYLLPLKKRIDSLSDYFSIKDQSNPISYGKEIQKTDSIHKKLEQLKQESLKKQKEIDELKIQQEKVSNEKNEFM